ncbi:MAG: class I SAM-dependent methyltransferase, partial [Chloroflexota bacterium]|nr:class I SAM-dependent methyltransferase [Chloroflexota bacterium]
MRANDQTPDQPTNAAADSATRRNAAEPGHLERGRSTAAAANLSYRLGKLRQHRLPRGRWLDCGCAEGGYSRALIDAGAEYVVGIEVELDRLVSATSAPGDIAYACAASEYLPFSTASFDGVFLNEVLEHVADEARTLAEIFRVLRPGGHLVVMSPNRWFPFEGHGMRIRDRSIDVPIPLLPWLPLALSRRFMRARNYWPGELRDLVGSQGFEILASSSVFPMFEYYPWLPRRVVSWYRRALPMIERTPLVQHTGVS